MVPMQGVAQHGRGTHGTAPTAADAHAACRRRLITNTTKIEWSWSLISGPEKGLRGVAWGRGRVYPLQRRVDAQGGDVLVLLLHSLLGAVDKIALLVL